PDRETRRHSVVRVSGVLRVVARAPGAQPEGVRRAACEAVGQTDRMTKVEAHERSEVEAPEEARVEVRIGQRSAGLVSVGALVSEQVRVEAELGQIGRGIRRAREQLRKDGVVEADVSDGLPRDGAVVGERYEAKPDGPPRGRPAPPGVSGY